MRNGPDAAAGPLPRGSEGGVAIGHVGGSIINSIIANGHVFIDKWFGGDGGLLQRQARAKAMLGRRVQEHWIEAVLAPRLIGQEFLPLGLLNRTDLLGRPPLTVAGSSAPQTSSDANAALRDFGSDGAFQQLLVLGEPGAGKTMFLLALTRQGLARFAADAQQDLPVVVGLAAWQAPPDKPSDRAQNRSRDGPPGDRLADDPFARWLQREIARLYRVPVDSVRELLEAGALTLMLDGLDELPEAQRAPCAEALQACCAKYLGRVVLSCRRADYESLPLRLVMDAALQLEPLTDGQVGDVIARHAGPELAQALTSNAELCELCRTPLMLSVLLTLERPQLEALRHQGASPQALFDAHLDMACTRRQVLAAGERDSLLHALGAMAREMQSGNWSALYRSDVGPSWFTRRWQRWVGRGLVGAALLLGVCLIGVWILPSIAPSLAGLLRLHVFVMACVAFVGCFMVGIGVSTGAAFLDRLGWRWQAAGVGAFGGLVAAGALALMQLLSACAAVLLMLPLTHWILGGSVAWVFGVYGGIALALLLSHLFFVEFDEIWHRLASPPLVSVLGLLAADWLAHGSAHLEILGTFHALRLAAVEIVVVGPLSPFHHGSAHQIGAAILLTLSFSAVAFPLIGMLVCGIQRHELERRKQRTDAIARQFRLGLALAVATFAGALALLYAMQAASRHPDGLATLATMPAYLAALAFCALGGLAGVAHVVVRSLLVVGGSLPPHFTRWLDKAASAGLILRAGGGWMFIHRMQQEYFARNIGTSQRAAQPAPSR